MSSNQVRQETIQKVVALLSKGEFLKESELQELGQQLTDMNNRAVCTNRNIPRTVIPYRHKDLFIDGHKMSTGDLDYLCSLLKPLDNFIYQCSEGNIPDEQLYKRCVEWQDSLRAKIIYALPQYESASMV